MKTLSIFLVFVFLVSSTVIAQEQKNPIEGTWELILKTASNPDTTVTLDISNQRELKIITASHFVFVMQSADGTEFIGGGGGRYTYEDNTYTETYDFSSFLESLPIGKSIEFSARFEGDKFYQTGMLKDNSGAEYKMENIFRRVK